MPFSELQIFHPSAISGFAIRTDALPKPLTLPHNLKPADKERLVVLLLSALRAGGVQPGNLIRLQWENRFWLNSDNSPAVACRSEDVFWLIVEAPVESAELFSFIDGCDCLTLIDFRYPSEDEHVQWLAVLKNSLLDAVQSWWRRFVRHDEADEVNFTPVRRWFESPIDALDYCNTLASGLFEGHSLIYVERQAMAAILAGKAQSLPVDSLMALVAFALRERWAGLRFAQPKPLPDFAPHYAEWQTVGLGWLAGEEFVPLPAIERLAERETLEPFFASWPRTEENAALHEFWEELRTALIPPVAKESLAESRFSSPDAPVRPAENMLAGTCGTAEEIREDISKHFPELPPDADDAKLQDAMAKETDGNRRLLLLAWRVCSWLDRAADRAVSRDQSLRAENDVARTIAQIWKELKPQTADQTAAFVSESWARLRAALADHLTERARLGATTQLIGAAREHLTQSLAIFRALNFKQYEAGVLKAMGDLLMRVDELAGARANYEKALPIYQEIEDRLGEANVLFRIGNSLMRVADLAGARACYEKALPIYRQIGDRLGEANVLQVMGDLLMRLNDLAGARERLEQALPIYRQLKARLGEANVLKAIGDLQMLVDELAGAQANYEQALPIYREIEDWLGEANVLKAIGNLLIRVDDLVEARARLEQALPIYREIENRLGEANVLVGIGKLALLENNQMQADQLLAQAIAIYRTFEDRYSIAAQTGNYGEALLRLGEKQKARPYLLRAAELFTEMGWHDYAERYRAAAEDDD